MKFISELNTTKTIKINAINKLINLVNVIIPSVKLSATNNEIDDNKITKK